MGRFFENLGKGEHNSRVSENPEDRWNRPDLRFELEADSIDPKHFEDLARQALRSFLKNCLQGTQHYSRVLNQYASFLAGGPLTERIHINGLNDFIVEPPPMAKVFCFPHFERTGDSEGISKTVVELKTIFAQTKSANMGRA